MAIDVTLQGTGSGTELLGLFDVKGEGPLKPIVDRLFERRATERAAQFAGCLEKRFGAAAQASAPAWPRAGALKRWLARLWRAITSTS